MKKILLAICTLVAFGLTSEINAQKSYVEANFGLSTYTQTYTYKTKLKPIELKTDFTVMNLSAGYNFALSNNLYLGATLGYSKHTGDELGFGAIKYKPEVSLFTISPKVTYYYALGNTNFYWTPNLYVTVGFGKEELMSNTDIKYMNYRIGINPLSFDFRVTKSLSINATALTPYYNILSTSLSNSSKSYDISTDNAFVYLGGQLGIKLYF